MRATSRTMLAPLTLPLVHEATERGVDRAAMMKALGLEDGELFDAERRVPAEAVFDACDPRRAGADRVHLHSQMCVSLSQKVTGNDPMLSFMQPCEQSSSVLQSK